MLLQSVANWHAIYTGIFHAEEYRFSFGNLMYLPYELNNTFGVVINYSKLFRSRVSLLNNTEINLCFRDIHPNNDLIRLFHKFVLRKMKVEVH